ncbi:hypothetical protein CRUP_013495 [Coryphaenoides rupestris]|nr:hypothetical protein CRUP_013495 [Coryphaenoides rupestris]
MRNTLRFLLGNLQGFDPRTQAVTDAYGEFDAGRAIRALQAFITRDLSGFYFSIVKDRLYCDPESSVGRRSCQTVLEEVLDGLTRSIAPILPHLAEEVYLHAPGHDGGACAIRDSFLSAIPGKNAAQYELTVAIEPGLLFELMESLQEEPTSTCSQLTELMMSARTTLTSALPRDLPTDAVLSSGSFLINLEGGMIREDSPYTVAVVPTCAARCPRCRRYTSDTADCLCPRCQTVLSGAA